MSYTFATTVSLNGTELEVEVSYNVTWGTPETGRFGPPEDYNPGSPEEVEFLALVRVNDRTAPFGLMFGYLPESALAEAVFAILESSASDAMINHADEIEESRFEEHQPDEAQEWADYDPDC